MKVRLQPRVTTTMSLDVHVASDVGAFDNPAWQEILRKEERRQVFATPEWNRVWWEEFGEGKDLGVLSLSRDSEVVGIVPLYRKEEHGRKILRFVGGIDLSDYLGPICAVEDRGDVADALVSWLKETSSEWDEFDAHNMPVPFGFADLLVERADRAGFSFLLDQEETAAVLPLAPTWDDYLESLEAKERHELKRKRRRLFREHPDASIRSSTPETLERDLEIFFEMHRDAEGLKGHFMDPGVATFFARVARAFSPLGWLRLEFLEIGERALASTFGFGLDGALYLYNSAFDVDARRLSPGMLLVAHQIEGAIGAGLHTFDFMRGPERYKYKLGAQAVPLNNLRVLREET